MKKTILLALALFAVATTASAQKKKSAVAPPPPPPPAMYDPNVPLDALKMDRKITSSLKDGEECVYYWEGNVYSRIAGEKDRHLFHYIGMNVRASKTVNDPEKGWGWRHVSREVLFYQDPKTGEILNKWTNPITGEVCDVVHVANDPVNGRGASFSVGPNGPYKLKGQFLEGKFMQTTEVPLFYENPLQGEYQKYVGGTYHAMEIFNTVVDEKDLRDATKDKATEVVIAWSRLSKFLPWMQMGDRQGWAIFSGTGKKMAGGFEAMPEQIKAEIRKNYPEYEHAPSVDDTRPNETSWTVFKKFIEKKKSGK